MFDGDGNRENRSRDGDESMKHEWIQGKRSVEEAIRANRQIGKIYFAEGMTQKSIKTLLQEATDRNIPFFWVPRAKLDRISKHSNHQGVIAQVAPYKYSSLDDCFRIAEQKNEQPFFLLLDGIEDPHNFGSILRTAEAAGVHGVIIPKNRAVGLTTTVAKTSAGAIEYVPVVRVTNLKRIADILKEEGLWIIGSAGDADKEYQEMDYHMPLALVIGNEGKGMSQLMKKKCDFLVRLPMKGRISSLNASVAAGILLYEVMRSREANG